MAEGIINKEIVVTSKTLTVTTNEVGYFGINASDIDSKQILAVDIDPSTTNNHYYTVLQMVPNQFRVYFMADGKNGWDLVKNVTIKIIVYLI